MREEFYRQTAAIEEGHWWFINRRCLVEDLLRRHGAELSTMRVLDVGCGSGGEVRWFERRCETVVGIDRSALALRIAAEKNPRSILVQADARRVDDCFAAASFDLVSVFSVLYHRWVDDVGSVLARFRSLLRPGGLLVVNEPALPLLSRRHDRIGYGARRFRRRELDGLLQAAGFDVLRSCYFGVPALPPALLVSALDRVRDRLATSVDGGEVLEMNVPAAPINRLLLAVTGIERIWIRTGLPTPPGVALLALARRAAD